MPFTLSHAAAVMGLRRSGLPMVGLVTGSMVPDLPMFGIVPYGYGTSHSLLGLVTVDLLAGTAAVAVWVLLIKGLLVDASPRLLRDRLPDVPFGRRDWLLVPAAVVVGAVTHVVWDAFTHEGRWGYRHIAWLRTDHLGHAGFHWAQAVSSAGGLLVLAVVVVTRVSGRTSRAGVATASGVARWAVALVAVATTAVGLLAAGANLDDGLHAAAFAAAVRALGVLAVGLLLAGGVWRWAAARAG